MLSPCSGTRVIPMLARTSIVCPAISKAASSACLDLPDDRATPGRLVPPSRSIAELVAAEARDGVALAEAADERSATSLSSASPS